MPNDAWSMYLYPTDYESVYPLCLDWINRNIGRADDGISKVTSGAYNINKCYLAMI